jgi:hypothetical protein
MLREAPLGHIRVRPVNCRFVKFGFGNVRPENEGSHKFTVVCLHASEGGALQLHVTEVGALKESPCQVSALQLRPSQRCALQMGLNEIRAL